MEDGSAAEEGAGCALEVLGQVFVVVECRRACEYCVRHLVLLPLERLVACVGMFRASVRIYFRMSRVFSMCVPLF